MTLLQIKTKIADKKAAGEDYTELAMQEAILMIKLSHRQSLRKFHMSEDQIDLLVTDDAALEWLLRDINDL